MKNNMDLPGAKYINNRIIETQFGNLEFNQGFPTQETTDMIFDFRTIYRTAEVFNQNTFAASLYKIREGLAEVGTSKPNQVAVWKDRADAATLFLTGNSETIYAWTFLDLKNDGPTVIEAPPKLLGLLDDMWMHYIADIGNAGPDKGAGGKFLILPPGYEGDIPEGYFVSQSKTYGVWVLLRATLDADGNSAAANERYEQLKIYPLSMKDNPEPTELIDVSGVHMDTIHAENYEMLEELGHLVEQEHPDALSNEQKFLLASIGMEFGKPFNPDARTKKLLEKGAEIGSAMIRTNMWNYVGKDKYVYEDRLWWNPFVGGDYLFSPNGYLDYDAQALFAVYATGVTPAMAATTVGVGSQYLCGHQDSSGAPLDGGKNYKLNIPKDIPARDFWSVIVYDSRDRSMLKNSDVYPVYPTISTYTDPEVNSDGSIDIYFGPTAPEGKEENWIKTLEGVGWTTIFRAYGPEQSFFDQTWKLNDIEEI